MKTALRTVAVTLEEEVARWARLEAARQDTSVSRLLSGILKQRMMEADNYEKAMRRALSGKPLFKGDGKRMTREEMHERTSLRLLGRRNRPGQTTEDLSLDRRTLENPIRTRQLPGPAGILFRRDKKKAGSGREDPRRGSPPACLASGVNRTGASGTRLENSGSLSTFLLGLSHRRCSESCLLSLASHGRSSIRSDPRRHHCRQSIPLHARSTPNLALAIL